MANKQKAAMCPSDTTQHPVRLAEFLVTKCRLICLGPIAADDLCECCHRLSGQCSFRTCVTCSYASVRPTKLDHVQCKLNHIGPLCIDIECANKDWSILCRGHTRLLITALTLDTSRHYMALSVPKATA